MMSQILNIQSIVTLIIDGVRLSGLTLHTLFVTIRAEVKCYFTSDTVEYRRSVKMSRRCTAGET